MSNQGNQNRGQSDLCNVGAAWRKQSDSGNEYFAVKIEQNIRAGTWLKLFWRRDQSDPTKPALSLCGELKDGFQQSQYDNNGGNNQGNRGGQNRGNAGGNRGNYGNNGNQNNRGGGYGGGGNQGNRSNHGNQNRNNGNNNQNQGYQNQNSNGFQDDLNVDEIPF